MLSLFLLKTLIQYCNCVSRLNKRLLRGVLPLRGLVVMLYVKKLGVITTWQVSMMAL
jgi:hypothetical protein